MPYSYLNLKSEVRTNVFPAGESQSLVKRHDKAILDCLIDLQTFVVCLQQDNTDLFPQCSTLFLCGMTAFDAPRWTNAKLSVVDSLKDADGNYIADTQDWCGEVTYLQVEPCEIRNYMVKSRQSRCIIPASWFFGLDRNLCRKGCEPVATDAGVPAGLPLLPLGYHYPQSSTDCRRALAGVWAIEGNKVYVAPWLNTTETVIVKWEGIKRSFTDGDLIDDDPLLKRCVEKYLLREVEKYDNRDEAAAAAAEQDFFDARTLLMKQCRDEQLVRGCTPFHARGSPTSIRYLFYNDEQSYNATCQNGSTGNPVLVTIPAGTVGSSKSKADANQLAQNDAKTQAEAQLNCSDASEVFHNDIQSHTAHCDVTEGSPVPDGEPVTVTITANDSRFDSTISKAAANAAALAQAIDEATTGLSCTYWNAAQTYTAECPSGTSGADVPITKAAHTYSSPLSQDAADNLAMAAAQLEANAALVCSDDPTLYQNTTQFGSFAKNCTYVIAGVVHPCAVSVSITVSVGRFTSYTSQLDANTLALNYARSLATSIGNSRCASHACGNFSQTY